MGTSLAGSPPVQDVPRGLASPVRSGRTVTVPTCADEEGNDCSMLPLCMGGWRQRGASWVPLPPAPCFPCRWRRGMVQRSTGPACGTTCRVTPSTCFRSGAGSAPSTARGAPGAPPFSTPPRRQVSSASALLSLCFPKQPIGSLRCSVGTWPKLRLLGSSS